MTLAQKLETHLQQRCSIWMWKHLWTTRRHTQRHKTVGIGMQLRSGRSDNQLWRNAPKPPPYTLTHTTHTSTYLHPVKIQNQLTDVCVCMSQMFTVMAKPNVSSGHMKTDISILYCETTFIMNTVIDTNTPTHPGPSLHSQSQIRWQIRRLMLLGGCGIGVPPLLQVVPQDTYTNLTRTS